MKESTKLTLRVPPPLVTLIFSGIMFLFDYFYPLYIYITIQNWLIASLLIISSFLLLPAVTQFYKRQTTVNPLKPEKAKVLVVDGIYRYSRNPMYLGMACILLAWGVFLGNPFNLITFFIFIFYMNYFQISREEEALEKIFGDDFKGYMRSVRRWV